jgi:hypothetical protein
MSERAGATVVETPGSHSIYVSQPAVVVKNRLRYGTVRPRTAAK